MLDAKQIFEWLKLPKKQALILFIITSILLFSGNNMLNKLDLLQAKEYLQIWIGLIWLISISVLLTEIIIWTLQKIKKQINLKSCQKKLHYLTPEEKVLLSKYIDNNSKTTLINYANGIANELESAMIIRRASKMSEYQNVFSYNIQPWAWEYLNQHTELLK